MYYKLAIFVYLFFLFVISTGQKAIKTYYVDIGNNLTLPCSLQDIEEVMWVRNGREDNQSRRLSIEDNGALFLQHVDRNDSGTYTCLPASSDSDASRKVKVTVRTPPPPLVDVYVHSSTILAVIFWNISGDGGYPLKYFTAQYKLADVAEWIPISPNRISPNSRQIDVYKLMPNTTYAFRIWAINELGNSDITDILSTTLCEYSEQEIAEHMLAGVETFDKRMWVLAVGIVMGALFILSVGVCLVLYQECKVPVSGDGVTDEQEIIELVPNIILNPGFDCNSVSEQQQEADENSNSETMRILNNNTVIQPRLF